MNNDINKIKAGAFFWNTASGVINAGQSAIILILISYFLTKIDAGIYTIAIAIGNIVSVFSKYGMRNYQVTDIEEKYNFNQYLSCRIITIFITLFFVIAYLFVQYFLGNYYLEKILIVLFISLWYLIESIEDVYYGMYQQKGRLDIGAKYFTIRLLISAILMCGLIFFKISLLISSIFTFIISLAFALIFIKKTIGKFQINKVTINFKNALNILLICFPLSLATTLSIYIGNSPKYFIDFNLNDTSQAIFGYLMMPAFTIMVINQFIYQPIIRDLGELWYKNEKNVFVKKVFIQYIVVAFITLITIALGATLGIPVLNILYNTSLESYRKEFVVLLLGGGFFALSSFVMVPLTAMRLQKQLALGFIAVSIISFIIGPIFVQRFEILGASLLYLILNVLLSIYLTVCILIGCREKTKTFK